MSAEQRSPRSDQSTCLVGALPRSLKDSQALDSVQIADHALVQQTRQNLVHTPATPSSGPAARLVLGMMKPGGTDSFGFVCPELEKWPDRKKRPGRSPR